MRWLARHPRTRRLAAAAVVVAALAAAWGAGVEVRWIEVTHHTLGAPEPGRRPLRVVHLSDVHVRHVGSRERRLAELVRAERPDLVVLSGDLLGEGDALAALGEVLGSLGGVPVLGVEGNWEHLLKLPEAALRETFAAHGARLLVNEVAFVERDGRRVAVVGLDDWSAGAPDPGRAAAGLAAERNLLLLEHEPGYRETWPGALPVPSLMLSGHTHGGQIAVIGRAVLPPGSGRYLHGWYGGAPFPLYVSRGVGWSVLPIRLGARPEIVVIDWWLR